MVYNHQWEILIGGADIDNSYIIERRERWSKEGNTATTKKFYQLIMNTPDIIVLAGHIHTNSKKKKKKLIQLTTGLSRDGHYRIIEFTK